MFYQNGCLQALLLIFPFICSPILSFQFSESNIDLNHPIVITDQFSSSSSSEKEQGLGSLFGFANVLTEDEDGKGWIIIGAPKSNTSDRDYKGVYEPGVLWRCSLGRGNNNTCRILFVDPINSQIGKADCKPNACPNESHTNSSLGFTIAINGDRLVVCAPNWQRQIGRLISDFKYNGLCYWLPKSILFTEPFSMTTMISSGFRSQRLFPLLDKGMQVRENYPIWAWGQTGFSVHLNPSAPDSKDSNVLYLGAPGVNGWNGTIIKYQDQSSANPKSHPRPRTAERPLHVRQRPNNKNGTQPQFSEFIILQTEFVQHYFHLEYLGYALTSGKYFQNSYNPIDDLDEDEDDENKRISLVAASAPRGGRLHGVVLIFEFPAEETPLWLPVATLQGTQFGAYFGSALCSVDMNNDGLDELLVGAPFQDHVDKEENEIYSSGCVFVYTAKKERYKFSEPTLICDSKFNGAQFASTIANLGDINADGFQDVAIGAPYENNGQGAVYIYYGSSTFALSSDFIKYSVKITPKSINLNLYGFGMSIFGNGVDIDGNGSNDFSIGAPLSSPTVIIIRTRQTLQFESFVDIYLDSAANDISGNNKTEESLRILPIDVSYFIIRSCARIAKTEFEKTFDVQIKLTVDDEYERFQIFEPPPSIKFEQLRNGAVLYKTTVHSSSKHENHCTEWITRPTSELNEVNPKPIRILQELLYKDLRVHESKSISNYTIIKNAKGVPNLVINVEDGFCPHCPPITKLTTELHIPIASDNCNDDGNPICSPHLELQINFLVEKPSYKLYSAGESFVIGSSMELVAEIIVMNLEDGETAYFPTLEFYWNKNIIPIVGSEEELAGKVPGNCSINGTDENLKYICKLGDTLQRNDLKSLRIPLNLYGLYAKEQFEELTFTASVSSLIDTSSLTAINENKTMTPKDSNLISNSVSTSKLIFEADTHLEFQGSMENATFSPEENSGGDESFTKLQQTYVVELKGQSPIQSLQLSFWFPTRKASKNPKAEQEIILIGQPRGSTCKIITLNAAFYNEPKSTPTSDQTLRILQAREILDKSSSFYSSVGGYDDRRGRQWILPISRSKDFTTPDNNTSPDQVRNNTKNGIAKPFITKLAEDSRRFLEKFSHVLRCTNENDESCVQIDCQVHKIIPNRALLIKFPLYIKNVAAGRIFLDKSSRTTNSKKSSSQLLIQSLARAQIFEGESDETMKMASFVTILGSSSSIEVLEQAALIPMIWIYLISVMLGLIIFVIIVYCLVKCGFFKREQPTPQWKPLNPIEKERVGD